MNTFENITLEAPIKRGEQDIKTLQIRTPVSGDLRGLELFKLLQADVDSLAILLPRITQPTLTKADVYRLELIDLIKITAAIFQNCQLGKVNKDETQDELPILEE